MRRIIIKEARPGMVAARTLVATEDGQRVAVAKAGEVLGVEHLVRLHELGVYDLWIQCRSCGWRRGCGIRSCG